jgi:metal-responsive CopG/Arc/MetJ family transcriptional regulator
LVARIDAWALRRGKKRSDAVRHLIEIGLEQTATSRRRDEEAIERLAEDQIKRLIDPDISQEERERRIHRLTEGPPEFAHLRIDLPRNKD